MKNIILILILIPILLNSCVTYNACEKRFSKGIKRDTITIRDTIMVPVQVIVPADSIGIYTHLSRLKQSDTVVFYSPDSLLQLKQYWLDSVHGVLATKESYKKHIIHDTVPYPVYYKIPCPACEQFAPEKKEEKERHGFGLFLHNTIRVFTGDAPFWVYLIIGFLICLFGKMFIKLIVK